MRVIITLMLPVVAFSGDGVIHLFREDDPSLMPSLHRLVPPEERSDLFRVAPRSRPVVPAPEIASMDQIAPSNQLVVHLFNDMVLTASVDRVSSVLPGTVSVRARIQGSDYGYLLFSTTDGRSLGRIAVPELGIECAVVFEQASDGHYLLDLKDADTGFLEGGPPLIPPDPPPRMKPMAEPMPVPYSSTDPAVIDVMVVYTPAAKSWAGGTSGMATLISQIMGQAQLVHDNSGTLVVKRLVHAAQVDYKESGDSGTDLDQLTYGHIDEVHTWRDQYGADLVILLTKVEDVGGLAWLLKHKNGYPDYAFSITRVQQASWTYTAIHEMGHNMGANHHKDQNVQPGPTGWHDWPENEWSAGWRWQGNNSSNYCSVMTYEDGKYFSDGQKHTHVAHFSNPNIQYGGVATGDAEDGDNARTLREMRHVIAGYRHPPSVVLSGMVLDERGVGIGGVKLAGLPGPPFTESDGSYTSSVDYGWSGTVTPQKAHRTFDPPSRTYSYLSVDLMDENFTGSIRAVWAGGAASGGWLQDANWVGGSVPPFGDQSDLVWQSAGAGHPVSFTSAEQTARSITFDEQTASPVQIRTEIGPNDPSPAPLIFASSTGESQIVVSDGADGDIELGGSGAIYLANPLYITHDGSGTLTLRGLIDSTPDKSATVAIRGSGPIEFAGAHTLPAGIHAAGGIVHIAGEITGPVSLSWPSTLGGSGCLVGNLDMHAGSKILFDPETSLTVTNGIVTLDEEGGFGIYDLVGLDETAPFGIHPLIHGTVEGSLLNPTAYEDRIVLGSDKATYFLRDETALQVVVLEEGDPTLTHLDPPQIDGETVRIILDPLGGWRLTLQYRESLTQGIWSNISETVSSGESTSLLHTETSAPSGFYRILVAPP